MLHGHTTLFHKARFMFDVLLLTYWHQCSDLIHKLSSNIADGTSMINTNMPCHAIPVIMDNLMLLCGENGCIDIDLYFWDAHTWCCTCLWGQSLYTHRLHMVWRLILLLTRGQSVYIHRLHMVWGLILLVTRGQSVYIHRLHCRGSSYC